MYPRVFDRVKAAVIDSVVLLVFMMLAAYVFSIFADASELARMIVFVCIFCVYDPFFTSFFGGTIGHSLTGIQVKRSNNPEKNIMLPLAIIRFLIKASFGWISLLVVMSNEENKALHDMLSGSIVIYK